MGVLSPPAVGCHVRVGGGLVRGGLRHAAQAGAEAIQVFVSNPRGWATSAGDPRDDTAFREACTERGTPVFVHAPYLVNLASPTEQTRERSLSALDHALRRGRALGARGVVVHTGSTVDDVAPDVALRQVREAVLPLLDALPADGPDLLLEPTAGQGRSLCSTIDELGPYLAALEGHPRVGVCLDTCHAFAAGHDLATPGGTAATLDALVATTGPGRLRLVHANDSRDPRGSRHDRHAPVGAGHIGEAAFAELLVHPALAGVAVVVETPGDVTAHRRDVALLKALRDR